MTTPQLKFNTVFPPAQERTIRLALEQSLITDKAQARAEGVSPRSINDRWHAIADRLALGYGHRERAAVVVALVRSRTVEFLMLVVAVWTGAMPVNGDLLRTSRTLRGGKPAACARREGCSPALSLDLDTGTINWS